MSYVILTAQCISQPSTEKLLTGIDGDEHRNPKLNKVQRIRDFRILSMERNIRLAPPYHLQEAGE